jgi:hypothetical protein
VLIYFLELRRVLILIDGPNEAAGNRHLFERMMDHTAGANNVSLMVSTRDYEFKTSRMQARFGGFEKLSGFEAFTIRPLDEQRRDELIERRLLPEQSNFRRQLVAVAQQTICPSQTLALLCCCSALYSPCRFADSWRFPVAALPSANALCPAPAVNASGCEDSHQSPYQQS